MLLVASLINPLKLFYHKQMITEMTGGGADYCFECVGQAALVEEAYACCRKVYVTLRFIHIARIKFISKMPF